MNHPSTGKIEFLCKAVKLRRVYKIAINWVGIMGQVYIGGGGVDQTDPQALRLEYANRHGLITGATGTGKTVTLQIMAEGFAAQGVPVFLSDVKGDLSGMMQAGSPEFKLHDAFRSRADKIGFADYAYARCSVSLWDVLGQEGAKLRGTVAQMWPLLISRLLGLSEAQEGVMNIVFRIADEQGMLLLDLKDLRALLTDVASRRAELTIAYGAVSPQSIGAIQRRLLTLETQGGDAFFGEPALDLNDLIRHDARGHGVVNILKSDVLAQRPQLYATVMLWLLSELFENLPEVGDLDRPKMVFFFDEAHLLFEDAPKALVDRIEMVARLIRSKGVGVYFITQNPDDIPEDVLGQLGNRVQHALRAFTARDRKTIKRAAQTYYDNPRFKTEDVIQDLGVGEAITSFLDEDGAPSMVERTLIRPPSSRLGPATQEAIVQNRRSDPMAARYETPVDRNSAYEILMQRADQMAKEAQAAEAQAESASVQAREFNAARRYSGGRVRRSSSRGVNAQTVGAALSSALIKELRGTTGRRIVRGVLGGLFGGR